MYIYYERIAKASFSYSLDNRVHFLRSHRESKRTSDIGRESVRDGRYGDGGVRLKLHLSSCVGPAMRTRLSRRFRRSDRVYFHLPPAIFLPFTRSVRLRSKCLANRVHVRVRYPWKNMPPADVSDARFIRSYGQRCCSKAFFTFQ